jgi:hypothetical protein
MLPKSGLMTIARNLTRIKKAHLLIFTLCKRLVKSPSLMRLINRLLKNNPQTFLRLLTIYQVLKQQNASLYAPKTPTPQPTTKEEKNLQQELLEKAEQWKGSRPYV